MGILENVYTGSCERGYGTGRGGGGGLRWGYRILVRGAGMWKRSSWDKLFHLLNNPVSHGGEAPFSLRWVALVSPLCKLASNWPNVWWALVCQRWWEEPRLGRGRDRENPGQLRLLQTDSIYGNHTPKHWQRQRQIYEIRQDDISRQRNLGAE